MSVAPIGSVRDATANRAFSVAPRPGASSVQVMGGDIDRPFFCPVPSGVHTVATAAAGRTWTITNAAAALPYDLAVGEGFSFAVQNNGANTITLAVAGGVSAGAGTITVPTARVRLFVLTRTGEATYQLDTLGVLTQ